MNSFYITFLTRKRSFICTELNDFKYYYVTLTIQFNIGHLFAAS